jgi:hypothetical protein
VTDPSRPLPPGYELVRVLGEGGFGEVLLARHESLDRLVAIKRVHAFALGSAEELARFRREARVLASLDHPAVVRVLDFLLDDRAGAALVMEYVPGSTLADLLRDGPLPAPRALTVLRDVAAALEVAGSRGIVHRDIKAANVFVLPDGSAKLGDFGIARVLGDPAVFRTTDGSVRGTPGYMAPEAGLGEGEVDARSDAYAFAVLAFETLTGRLPFGELDMAAALVAHWSRPAPSASEVLPGFPGAAAEALAAGLAKDPDVRPKPSVLVDRLAAVPAGAWPEPGTGPSGGAAASASAPPTIRGAGAFAANLPPGASALPRAVPALPPLPRRRRWLAVGLPALVLLGLAVWHWWPEGAPGPLAVQDAVLTLDPASGGGGCPSAAYRVAAEVTTTGAGELTFAWELPDGRTTAAQSVPVDAAQQRVELSLSFELTGPPSVNGAPVLLVTAPADERFAGPVVDFRC